MKKIKEKSRSIPSNILWFKYPARSFEEALPIGNGRFGGMVYGGVEEELITLNEDSIWSGSASNRENPEVIQNLEKVRNMLVNNDYLGAGMLAEKAMTMPLDPGYGAYQPLGDLTITFNYNKNDTSINETEKYIYTLDENSDVETTPADDKLFLYKSYKRELNLETAVAKTEYTITELIEDSGINGYTDTRFSREVFSSAVDNVIAVYFTSDKPSHISCDIVLSRKYGAKTLSKDNDMLLMEGKCEYGGVKFAACLRVIADKGEVISDSNTLHITNADHVLLLIAANSTYRFSNPSAKCLEQISKASHKGYNKLKEAHITDYSMYFNRVKFELDNEACMQDISKDTDDIFRLSLPVNELLRLLKNDKDDPRIFTLYFNYGRYLLISTSRPGTLPPNLQGIWNESFEPPWFSDYTLNGSVQMNYWPSEGCNLAETTEPLFNFIDLLYANGVRTAADRYGCRGFVLSNRTTPWGRTDLRARGYLIWQEGAGWLCQHLWEHYLFSKDKNFLKNRAYPLMKEAALFYIDFMMVHPENGWLISGPTSSPENSFITSDGIKSIVCMSPAMTTQIISDLFSACIEAGEILNCDEDFRNDLKKKIEKLPPMNIGKLGQLQEWIEDFEDADPGHRFISHLYGVYPGRMISVEKTPELANAAKVSLERRVKNGCYTGKSAAWALNIWARLKEGDKAYDILKRLLCNSTFPNLLSNHYRQDGDVFQIDGNFGGTSGIAEMLLSGFKDEIYLLPALPSKWLKGCVKGLRARGGYTVNISWEDGWIENVEIYSKFNSRCIINYKDKRILYDIKAGQKITLDKLFFDNHNDEVYI